MNPLTKLRDWLNKPVRIPSLPDWPKISLRKQTNAIVVPKDWVGNERIIKALKLNAVCKTPEHVVLRRFKQAMAFDRKQKNWNWASDRFEVLGLIIEGRYNTVSKET